MKQPSVSTRIKGIQSAYGVDTVDYNIQKTLLKLIREDESPNVRLAAIHALGNMNIQVDMNLLLQALENEKVPTVQIALIDALVKIKGKDAGPILDQLSLKPELPKVVQSEAELRKFLVNTL